MINQGTTKAPYSQLYKGTVSIEVPKVGFYSCITGLKLVLQVLKVEWKAAIKILEKIQFEEPQLWNHLDSAVAATKLHKHSVKKFKNMLILKSTSCKQLLVLTAYLIKAQLILLMLKVNSTKQLHQWQTENISGGVLRKVSPHRTPDLFCVLL